MSTAFLDAEVRRLRALLEKMQSEINDRDETIHKLTMELEAALVTKPGIKQAISETLHLKGRRGAI